MSAAEREELAWAAGFFDGEGIVGYVLRRTPSGTAQRQIYAQVSQSDRELLDRLVGSAALGVVRGPYRTNNPNARPYHVAAFNSFECVQALGARLWPWLGAAKREQFASALTAYRAFVPDVAVCEHGSPRQKCRPCRSEWAKAGWAKRTA